jgi:hypothetical protein
MHPCFVLTSMNFFFTSSLPLSKWKGESENVSLSCPESFGVYLDIFYEQDDKQA